MGEVDAAAAHSRVFAGTCALHSRVCCRAVQCNLESKGGEKKVHAILGAWPSLTGIKVRRVSRTSATPHKYILGHKTRGLRVPAQSWTRPRCARPA